MKPIDKIFESDNQNLEIQALKKAMKDAKDKRMYLRYKVIYLHTKGYTNLDIASLEGLDNHTVGIYVKTCISLETALKSVPVKPCHSLKPNPS